jgi:uncharacterized protein YijF (DUF1287 family)
VPIAPTTVPPAGGAPELAALLAAPRKTVQTAPTEPTEVELARLPIPEITAREELSGASAPASVCMAAPPSPPTETVAAATREGMGVRLARAARAQLDEFVIYNDRYMPIAYPMGDVPTLFGVCTDVVIRAYRTLGIDLQRLVHEARLGAGDPNIDHRRTEILRRFFAAYGQSLPVTEFAEDFQAGDIVTYYRPENRGTQAHIAIVADVVAPSGRPMIIHNRGWGPQMEDALFVDQITGHYRYFGPILSAASPFANPEAPKAPAIRRSRAPVLKASFAPPLVRGLAPSR